MQIPYRKPTKFTNLPIDPHITETKFKELTSKLAWLKNTARPQAAAEVARLAELGDFSENAEYQHAKGRLRGINNSILKIESHLNQAIVIKHESGSDIVELSSTVIISDGTAEKTYQILGSSEINIQKGIISQHSPIGAALLGHQVGDSVKIKLVNKEIEYHILAIK